MNYNWQVNKIHPTQTATKQFCENLQQIPLRICSFLSNFAMFVFIALHHQNDVVQQLQQLYRIKVVNYVSQLFFAITIQFMFKSQDKRFIHELGNRDFLLKIEYRLRNSNTFSLKIKLALDALRYLLPTILPTKNIQNRKEALKFIHKCSKSYPMIVFLENCSKRISIDPINLTQFHSFLALKIKAFFLQRSVNLYANELGIKQNLSTFENGEQDKKVAVFLLL